MERKRKYIRIWIRKIKQTGKEGKEREKEKKRKKTIRMGATGKRVRARQG